MLICQIFLWYDLKEGILMALIDSWFENGMLIKETLKCVQNYLY